MRVVRSSVYRRYTSSLNDLQSNLNKSMNKFSTGAAYETAADNPLAYYQGKKMDHLYQDAKSKSSILGDIKNRLYQQEQGARDIHEDFKQQQDFHAVCAGFLPQQFKDLCPDKKRCTSPGCAEHGQQSEQPVSGFLCLWRK